MNNSQDVPQGIIQAVVGLLLPYIPNVTTENLQRALETINNPNTGAEKDTRPLKPLTRKETADALGVSVQSVDRYLASGQLTRVRYSARAIRISADSVHKLMRGGMA